MNREILFRGKRSDDGEWAEGYLFLTKEHTYISYKNQFDDDLFLSPKEIFIEVGSSTVCQYTGLTDKNGRKIFEGDICKVDELIYKVSFKNSHWNFDIISEKVYCAPWFDSHCGEHCEVIGNIFDNPELIH